MPRSADDRNAALHDLLRHADTNTHLIDEVIKYQADHGNFAQPPDSASASTDDPPTTKTEPLSSRTPGARAVTIPSPTSLGECFRGSTPHRYAARR